MPSLDQLKSEPVFFFSDVAISAGGSGAAMRVYTNLRAYADLGFRIELIHFSDPAQAEVALDLPDGPIQLTRTARAARALSGPLQRLVYRLGFPREALLDARFPIREAVKAQVRPRLERHPNAIFHFEYDDFASAAVSFRGMNSVWSNHDLTSLREPMIWAMRDLQGGRAAHKPPRDLQLRRIRQIEDEMARACRLILNIAAHEHDIFAHERGYQQAVLFPMSWPDEAPVPRTRPWKDGGRLRLLHLGSVGGFIGFESLRFILTEVLPLLPEAALNQIEVWVAGAEGAPFYSQQIHQLAAGYPQVKFMGFSADLRALYGQVDLQIVGGQRAGGLRTRIIESMVYGVPVLSTREMAKGLTHLEDGVNILLADDAVAYAEILTRLCIGGPDLSAIARNARSVYDRFYSRKVCADTLAQNLERRMT